MLETATTPAIRPLGRPGDLGWVLMAHGELYTAEFGWDTSFETLVARILADYAAAAQEDGEHSAGWIAEMAGERVGCVFCVPDEEPGVAKLRLLLVQQRARGHELGHRLVAETIRFASATGCERMRLWTNNPLLAARHIYLRHGFRLIAEEPHRSFGVDLVGQTYELQLPGS